jgi:tRNA (guanine37-N1)-methyltransferase
MRVIVGRIGRPHGIRGEVVVGVRTDEPDVRFGPGASLDVERHGKLTVASRRWHSGQLLIGFAGITDRTAAAELNGSWLSVDSSELPPTGDPDEFRDHELIGLSVRTVAGDDVGVVSDILHHGQDVLVITATDTKAEHLVPFVKSLVPEVDPAAGVLVIDPPPGLLDLTQAELKGRAMRIDVITIFPEYFAGPLGASLIGKAAARGDIEFHVHDLRQWAHDVHHTVDDVPFGGGPGMVMKPDVWGEALDEIIAPGENRDQTLIVPTPSGIPFSQVAATRYAARSRLIFACGRYEGIDSRVVDHMRERMPVDEVSIGDYVLAGGEVAVLVMLEAVGRLLPGVLGNAASAEDDSFGDSGLLEGPVYTRPREWRGHAVPEVLLSGNHAAIARWRRDMALRRTAANRPDLIATLADKLDKKDRKLLAEATGFPVSGEDMAH